MIKLRPRFAAALLAFGWSVLLNASAAALVPPEDKNPLPTPTPEECAERWRNQDYKCIYDHGERKKECDKKTGPDAEKCHKKNDEQKEKCQDQAKEDHDCCVDPDSCDGRAAP